MLEFSLGVPVFKTLNQDFFKKWNPEMAYVLGFFVADGCMMKNKRGAHFIEFQITDRDLLISIKQAFNASHKISFRVGNERHRTRYRLQIGSKELFSDLFNLGVTPRKSKTIKLPSIPEEFFSHFLRGYFDGDGCVSLTKYWRKNRQCWYWAFTTRFTSGSKIFLRQLWQYLKKYISGGYLQDKSGSGYDLVFSRKDGLALFRLMYNNINLSSDLYLKRKYNKFIRAFKILKLGT